MTDHSPAGPFEVGDRVRVGAYASDGTVTEIGETQAVQVFTGTGPGSQHEVTVYRVRLDTGVERSIADRDGHLVRL